MGHRMALPARTHPLIARLLTSESFEKLQRQTARAVEKLGGQDATLRFFHDPRCARSWLLTEALIEFRRLYDVTIVPYLVPEAMDDTFGSYVDYYQYSFRDAQAQARYYGLSMPQRLPTQAEVQTVAHELASRPRDTAWLRHAHHLGLSLFQSTTLMETFEPVHGLDADRALLHQLGNYRGGNMFAHGGWYFGVDRLAHIEDAYAEAGLGSGHTLSPHPSALPTIKGDTIHFYFSFRSAFSYIALPRVLALAAHKGLRLNLHAVASPSTEQQATPLRRQILWLLDAAREGRQHHIHFGKIVDVSREQNERLIAIFYRLEGDSERQRRFVHAAMRAIWSRGIDFRHDEPWDRIQQEAKLTSEEIQEFGQDQTVLERAYANAHHLREQGYLDVPAFSIGETIYWGYDRLAYLEYQIQHLTH